MTRTPSHTSHRVPHRPRHRMMDRNRDAWKNRNTNRCEASSNAVRVPGETSEMSQGASTQCYQPRVTLPRVQAGRILNVVRCCTRMSGLSLCHR